VGRFVGECLSARRLDEARAVLTTGSAYQYEESRFARGIHQVLDPNRARHEIGSPLVVLLLRDVTAERRVSAEWQNRTPSSVPPRSPSSEEMLHQAQKMEALGS